MNRSVTALFVIAVPLAFNAAFFALGSAYNYPAILREPTDTILRQYVAGGAGLTALWYAFTFTALLTIPLALLLNGIFRTEQPQLSQAAATLGVIAGVVQVLGLLRWVFLVPGLAAAYVSGASDPATRAAAVMVFNSLHGYLGMGVGEHLGYLFTGAWTILLSVLMLRSRSFARWQGVLGIVAALGIMAGTLEPAGVGGAALVNAIAYVVWSLWMIAAGVTLLMRPAHNAAVFSSAAAA